MTQKTQPVKGRITAQVVSSFTVCETKHTLWTNQTSRKLEFITSDCPNSQIKHPKSIHDCLPAEKLPRPSKSALSRLHSCFPLNPELSQGRIFRKKRKSIIKCVPRCEDKETNGELPTCKSGTSMCLQWWEMKQLRLYSFFLSFSPSCWTEGDPGCPGTDTEMRKSPFPANNFSSLQFSYY